MDYYCPFYSIAKFTDIFKKIGEDYFHIFQLHVVLGSGTNPLSKEIIIMHSGKNDWNVNWEQITFIQNRNNI